MGKLTSFENLCKEKTGYDEIYFFHPSEDSKSLRDEISRIDEPINILAVIGPEGGFSEGEAALARSKQAVVLHLGQNILKVDTAFVTVAFALKTFLT